MSEIAIIGAGAWGTALALHALRLGHAVTLVARHPARLGRENPRLPGIPIPPELRIAAHPPAGADLALLAVPMQHLRPSLAALPGAAPLLLCCKGVELGTFRLPLEIAAELHPRREAAFLTGPNFAADIAAGLPAAAIIAGASIERRRRMLDLLGGGTFRLYAQQDAVGAQLGAAVKNVIAIAAGAVIGAGLGENARAALITRGLAEIARLIAHEGGRPETAAGLSGLGDLVLTCTGPASRNYSAGLALGRGAPPASLRAEDGPTIEALDTAPALLHRAAGVDMPICGAVARLLAGEFTLREAVAALLSRPARHE